MNAKEVADALMAMPIGLHLVNVDYEDYYNDIVGELEKRGADLYHPSIEIRDLDYLDMYRAQQGRRLIVISSKCPRGAHHLREEQEGVFEFREGKIYRPTLDFLEVERKAAERKISRLRLRLDAIEALRVNLAPQ